MKPAPVPDPVVHVVHRSLGKRPADSFLKTELRRRRIAENQARSSDKSESEDDTEPGTKILHKMFHRKVVLYPDNTVVKSGKRAPIGEARALEVAKTAGIPVPSVHHAQVNSDGYVQIRMDYVEGESLDKLWPSMSAEDKKDMCCQLRDILEKMRSISPAGEIIGACDDTGVRDTRTHWTYCHPSCLGEEIFNQFLLDGLFKSTPAAVRKALSLQLRTDHRIVLSHCDLAPRNILVQNGKIKGLVDWEDSGWYPEYWEYVKFFQRNADQDWKQYAEDIFPQLYQGELVLHMAISSMQKP